MSLHYSENLERLLERVDCLYSVVDATCERLDDEYIKLMEHAEDGLLHDAQPVLRAVLTHLKDARAALERAKGAIP
jgi:hypothetical protein